MADTPQESAQHIADRRRIDQALTGLSVVTISGQLTRQSRQRVIERLLPLLADVRTEWLAPRPIEHPPTSPELQAEWDRADRSYEARKAAGDAY
jgi:hypothetical protein